jgi:hypothetical protein
MPLVLKQVIKCTFQRKKDSLFGDFMVKIRKNAVVNEIYGGFFALLLKFVVSLHHLLLIVNVNERQYFKFGTNSADSKTARNAAANSAPTDERTACPADDAATETTAGQW